MEQCSRYRWIRYPFVFGIVIYTLGLTIYLLLRLILGDSIWVLAWLNNFTPYYFLPLLLTVPVALLIRAPRLTGFSLILLAIGAIWFLPRYIPNNIIRAAPITLMEIKVVTFNTPARGGQLERVANWLIETDADIVFLQETPRAWGENGVQELLELYPHQVPGWEWGNTTLSKFPITEANGNYFKIDMNGKPIALYNIHFWMPLGERSRMPLPVDSAYLRMFTRYDERGRNGQINDLLERLEAETLPFIVAGDFNMSDNAVIYDDLAAIMQDSFREAGIGIGASWPVASWAGLPDFIPPLVRIDYIWHSDHFTTLTSVQGPAMDSDHLPLVSTLALIQDN